MAAMKTALMLLLIAFALMVVTEAAVRVGPCDQVCSRIDAEKDECCRAHGHSGWSSCSGGMYCY
ncbi:spodomicin-like [Ostrinia furnacalis]|uniref:spodomicin-like n=1 Tax=Ostrinia furnacalis TaxID=93504 RepID=UPI00103C5335|nr:spodomicin-like [Ostrinia furnacalis]